MSIDGRYRSVVTNMIEGSGFKVASQDKATERQKNFGGAVWLGESLR
jgi:hypothetical protein